MPVLGMHYKEEEAGSVVILAVPILSRALKQELAEKFGNRCETIFFYRPEIIKAAGTYIGEIICLVFKAGERFPSHELNDLLGRVAAKNQIEKMVSIVDGKSYVITVPTSPS